MILRRRGFTLVELIVVITIIAILATVIIISYVNIQENVKKSKAKGDIQAFITASKMLKQDTGEYPGHLNDFCEPTANAGAGLLAGDSEFRVSHEYVGLLAEGTYKNWHGPYMQSVTNDPWGNAYWFDPDYICGRTGTSRDWVVGELEQACDGVPTGKHVGAIVSRHNSDEASSPNQYGGGNVAALICKHQ